ncbi:MAG: RNHCP domain-containing protein [Alphaproteobacteria bacterium]
MTTDYSFRCRRCGQQTSDAPLGTRHRNHCPKCLWSLHLDNQTGDRASDCAGLMEPIAVWVRGSGEWAIVHRCRDCSTLSSNRIAGDDNELVLMALAVRPLAQPPFPLEHLIRENS